VGGQKQLVVLGQSSSSATLRDEATLGSVIELSVIRESKALVVSGGLQQDDFSWSTSATGSCAAVDGELVVLFALSGAHVAS